MSAQLVPPIAAHPTMLPHMDVDRDRLARHHRHVRGFFPNGWMLTAERCIDIEKVGSHIGEIWQTTRAAVAYDEDAFSRATLREMLSHIDSEIEIIGALLGWSGKDLENLLTNAVAESHGIAGHRKWEPYES